MFKQVGLLVVCGAMVACAGSAGAEGERGASALTSVTPELPGASCPNGGEAFTYGVDDNANGTLDESEVQGTSFVCNGAAGLAGATGSAGAQGEKGEDGAAAAQGTAGAKGDTGAAGAAGATGATGATGAQGEKGDMGAAGADGAKGDTGATGATGAAGAPAVEPTFGTFLPSQMVKGAVVTCASVDNTVAGTTTCQGMKVDGLNANLTPTGANGICAVVTGKGYDQASGLGQVSAPFMNFGSGAWSVAATGTASPMQNLTCTR